MDVPATASNPTQRAECFKAVAFGFAITLIPLLALGGAQLLLASSTLRKAGFDPITDGWVVSQYQAVLVSFYAWVVAIIFAYWLLTGIFGSGQLLKIKSANAVLALSGLSFALAMAISSFVPMPAVLFKVICPVLRLPDTMPPLPSGNFGFDGQTPCEAFANGAAPTVLLGLPFILLVTSAIMRITLSRRQ